MNKKRRKSREEIIYHIIVVPVFLAFTFICVYPFYYLLICTISDNQAVELGKVLFAPVGFHLGNYIKIIKLPNLVNSVGVSLARVLVGVFLHLFACTYMAYFFTRQEMWARKFWYRLVVITMYFSAGLIPAYLNARMLKLPNTSA